MRTKRIDNTGRTLAAGDSAPTDSTDAVVAPLERALARRLQPLVAQLLTEQSGAREQARPPVSVGRRRETARALVADSLRAYERDSRAAGTRVPSPAAEARIVSTVCDSLFKVAGFQTYLDDPRVEHIDVNGADCVSVR